MSQYSAPQLLIINQTTSPAFSQWVADFASECGVVEFWCGNPPENPGSNVLLRRMPHYDKSSVLSRLRTWAWFTLVAGWWLVKRRHRPPLFVVTNPPFLPLLAWFLAKVRGFRYGLLEYDIYPQVAAATGLLSGKNLLYRLWLFLHQQSLRAAALTVTLNESMAEELRQTACSSVASIAVVPTWIDASRIVPVERATNPFAKELGIEDELVVLYSGNMGATHSIETIIAVAEHLSDDNQVVFLMLGDGAKRVLVEEAIQTGRTPNIRLLPWQPQENLPYTLSTGDIGIVTLSRGYERLSMPSKTYSIMAAGAAVLGISSAPNGLSELIETCACGSNFAPNDVSAIVDWIRTLKENRQHLHQLQTSARAAAARFSRDVCQPQLTQLVRQKLLQ